MRGLLVLLLIFICYHETEAVKCNDGCATLSDVVSKNGDSYQQELPKGLKGCSKKALKECGNGQVCVSTPVEFSVLVTENGKTLQNNTVKFVYSSCSGAGDTQVDCTNIGDKIAKQFNGTEFAKALEELNESKKHMAEVQKQLKEMSARLSKQFEEMQKAFDFFDFGMPRSLFEDDSWLAFDKRDEAVAKVADKSTDKDADKAADKANGDNSSNVRFYSMILGGCKESTIKRV